MKRTLRIGTRDSQLAVWQASLVQEQLKKSNVPSELVYIKSEGDLDTTTPLYALGVTGVFTKALDTALLNNRIDIAVHSMKDVPVQLAQGIVQAAVLKRGSHKDIFVYKNADDLHEIGFLNGEWYTAKNGKPMKTSSPRLTVATSSVRRIAQWLNRYPNHKMENLRGNVNTRLRKVNDSDWHGAIFAAAGLERINVRPENSVDLDWMLPAPAQGAIMVVCREEDKDSIECCRIYNDEETALCTKIERDFLSALMGGCSTPISALAMVNNGEVKFCGNVLSPDGQQKAEIEKRTSVANANDLGMLAATEILSRDGRTIVDTIRRKGLTANDEV